MKLSRAQAAEALHVTPKTLYSWERAGKIPPPERDWRGWRWYSDAHLQAIRRHMNGENGEAGAAAVLPTAPAETGAEKTVFAVSARNRLEGTITAIVGDGVLCEVVLRLPGEGGQEIVAVITRSSVERLGLAVGGTAIALIKSTEVLLAR